MKDIFDPCNLGNFKLKSRVIRTGIWETQKEEGGFLNQAVYDRYEQIAKSGVGAIISEMMILDTRDRFYDYSVNINNKRFVRDYSELTELVHKYNVPILGQLSFFFYNDGLDQKIEVNDLTLDGIKRLQTEIILAAKKLSFAGFDGIQLNLGNNFYLSRFINPYFNNRDDKYGGNTLNRVRMVLEIIQFIKKNFDLHVNCKVNPKDVRKGGMTEKETIEICKLLEKYGADSIQVTARTISFANGKECSHPFLDFANELISEINIPVILGGTLRDMETMNTILNKTDVELLSMSKPFVAQKDFLKEWKENKEGTSICYSCNNCYSKKTSTCFKYE